MSSAQLEARRATLDDLSGLRQLWQDSGVSDRSLEKRLTEFQIVEDFTDNIVACAGFQIAARQGFVDYFLCQNPEFRDSAQLLLWERIQALAQNHGLVRLWTQESGVFWSNQGFSEADDTLRSKIPSKFGESPEKWKTLQLRDESVNSLSWEQHLALLQQSQKKIARKTAERIRIARWFAGFVALVVLFAMIWLAWKMVNHVMVPGSAPGP